MTKRPTLYRPTWTGYGRKRKPTVVASPIAVETETFVVLDFGAGVQSKRIDKRFPSEIGKYHRSPASAARALAAMIRKELHEARRAEPKIWRRAKHEAAANRATIARLEKQLTRVQS